MFSTGRQPTLLCKNGLFFNRDSVIYTDYNVQVIVPPFEPSDGPTLNWFTKLFVTMEEYRIGIPAAHLHDYMCRNKEQFDRRVATKMLIDIWVDAGLSRTKGELIGFCINCYQLVKHGSEWKS